jgi:pyruvate dehydrogenase E2 component (dihydrolipoamide acetyltransferase)
MPELLLVPEVAAGATEVVIAEWLVQPGAAYSAGDAVAVIETEKAVVEMEAEKDGTLLKPLVDPGTTIAVGLPMALIGSSADVGTDLDAALSALGFDGASGSPAPERREVPQEPVVVAAQQTEEGAGSVAVKTETGASAEAGGSTATPVNGHAGGRLFISPIARKLLRDAGLVPEGLTGSGPGGRIRRRDVESLIANAPAAPAVSPTAATAAAAATAGSAPDQVAIGPWTDVPHSRLRRAVARRLTESKQQVPHFYVKRSVSLDGLLALRSQVNQATETKVSVNDFLIRAMAVAHQKVPDANVIWTEDAVRRFDHVDISVAIASDRGLVTPVLRSVETSSISSISVQVRAFVENANAGKLQQQDLEGGSITISNLGMYGVEEFAAIINPPQSAILAVGAGRPLPVVEDGEVVVRTVADLVLSVDHRAVDGALAAQWMTALVDAVHAPLTLLV